VVRREVRRGVTSVVDVVEKSRSYEVRVRSNVLGESCESLFASTRITRVSGRVYKCELLGREGGDRKEKR